LNSDLQENVKTDTPPGFLTIEFHVHFLPSLIRSRLRRVERTGTGFSSIFEFYVALAISTILVAIGIPNAFSHKSVTGWVVGGIGLAGILALLANSIFSYKDTPSYDRFLTGVFFFFLSLGITAGVFVGTLNHSLSLGLISGLGGLVAGYLLGILSGLWLQYLGWFSGLVNGLALLVTFGMLFVDMVLLVP